MGFWVLGLYIKTGDKWPEKSHLEANFCCYKSSVTGEMHTLEYKSLLNFTRPTEKFHNCHHTNK